MSDDYPISVNGSNIEVKRPLLNGSRIKILDKEYLWEFQRSSTNQSDEEILTPKKDSELAEQAPNSCPDLRPYRQIAQRLTVHNFNACSIHADEDDNKSIDSIASTSIDINASVTDLIDIDKTPNIRVLNATPDKETKIGEKATNVLAVCQMSDIVVTTFTPRETGVRIEKSFAAVLKPITPKSVYSTPKGLSFKRNVDDDDDSFDEINFSTPATTKKTLARVPSKSSMHLIDLTTPNKLSTQTSINKSMLSGRKTLGFSGTELGVSSLTSTPHTSSPAVFDDFTPVIDKSKTQKPKSTSKAPTSLVKRVLVNSASKNAANTGAGTSKATVFKRKIFNNTPIKTNISKTPVGILAQQKVQSTSKAAPVMRGCATAPPKKSISERVLTTSNARRSLIPVSSGSLNKIKRSDVGTSSQITKLNRKSMTASTTLLNTRKTLGYTPVNARARALVSNAVKTSIGLKTVSPKYEQKRQLLFGDRRHTVNKTFILEADSSTPENSTDTTDKSTSALAATVESTITTTINVDENEKVSLEVLEELSNESAVGNKPEESAIVATTSVDTANLLEQIENILNTSDELERQRHEIENNKSLKNLNINIDDLNEDTISSNLSDIIANAQDEFLETALLSEESLVDETSSKVIEKEDKSDSNDVTTTDNIQTVEEIPPTELTTREADALSTENAITGVENDEIETINQTDSNQTFEESEPIPTIMLEDEELIAEVDTTLVESNEIITENIQTFEEIESNKPTTDELSSEIEGNEIEQKSDTENIETIEQTDSTESNTVVADELIAGIESNEIAEENIKALEANELTEANLPVTDQLSTQFATVEAIEIQNEINTENFEENKTTHNIDAEKNNPESVENENDSENATNEIATTPLKTLSKILKEEKENVHTPTLQNKVATLKATTQTTNLRDVRDMLTPEKNVNVNLQNRMQTSKTTNKENGIENLKEKLLRTPNLLKINNDNEESSLRRSKRRASISASTQIVQPRRTARRASADASLPLTPKRITKRRPSIDGESDELISKPKTPKRFTFVDENMGAIVEELSTKKQTIDLIAGEEVQIEITEADNEDVMLILEESICEEVELAEKVEEVQSELIEEDDIGEEITSTGSKPMSPKTPVMIGVRELLKSSKSAAATPKLSGIRQLLKTPKPTEDNDKNLSGIAELIKTPKVVDVESCEFGEEADFTGVKEMMQTPKSCSTPRLKGLKELLKTPRILQTPNLEDFKELMDTPQTSSSAYKGKSITFTDLNQTDKVFKTPRGKNVMIPNEPPSAVLSNNLEVNSTHTLETINEEAEKSMNIEEKFTQIETSTNLTPSCKVYQRTTLETLIQSPFTTADVLSDLPKSEMDELLDSMENADNDTIDESQSQNLPTESNNESVFDKTDPISVTLKTLEAKRNSDISGINFLDDTNESCFSEALRLSDSDSEDEKIEDNTAKPSIATISISDSESINESVQLKAIEDAKSEEAEGTICNETVDDDVIDLDSSTTEENISQKLNDINGENDTKNDATKSTFAEQKNISLDDTVASIESIDLTEESRQDDVEFLNESTQNDVQINLVQSSITIEDLNETSILEPSSPILFDVEDDIEKLVEQEETVEEHEAKDFVEKLTEADVEDFAVSECEIETLTEVKDADSAESVTEREETAIEEVKVTDAVDNLLENTADTEDIAIVEAETVEEHKSTDSVEKLDDNSENTEDFTVEECKADAEHTAVDTLENLLENTADTEDISIIECEAEAIEDLQAADLLTEKPKNAEECEAEDLQAANLEKLTEKSKNAEEYKSEAAEERKSTDSSEKLDEYFENSEDFTVQEHKVDSGDTAEDYLDNSLKNTANTDDIAIIECEAEAIEDLQAADLLEKLTEKSANTEECKEEAVEKQNSKDSVEKLNENSENTEDFTVEEYKSDAEDTAEDILENLLANIADTDDIAIVECEAEAVEKQKSTDSLEKSSEKSTNTEECKAEEVEEKKSTDSVEKLHHNSENAEDSTVQECKADTEDTAEDNLLENTTDTDDIAIIECEADAIEELNATDSLEKLSEKSANTEDIANVECQAEVVEDIKATENLTEKTADNEDIADAEYQAEVVEDIKATDSSEKLSENSENTEECIAAAAEELKVTDSLDEKSGDTEDIANVECQDVVEELKATDPSEKLSENSENAEACIAAAVEELKATDSLAENSENTEDIVIAECQAEAVEELNTTDSLTKLTEKSVDTEDIAVQECKPKVVEDNKSTDSSEKLSKNSENTENIAIEECEAVAVQDLNTTDSLTEKSANDEDIAVQECAAVETVVETESHRLVVENPNDEEAAFESVKCDGNVDQNTDEKEIPVEEIKEVQESNSTDGTVNQNTELVVETVVDNEGDPVEDNENTKNVDGMNIQNANQLETVLDQINEAQELNSCDETVSNNIDDIGAETLDNTIVQNENNKEAPVEAVQCEANVVAEQDSENVVEDSKQLTVEQNEIQECNINDETETADDIQTANEPTNDVKETIENEKQIEKDAEDEAILENIVTTEENNVLVDEAAVEVKIDNIDAEQKTESVDGTGVENAIERETVNEQTNEIADNTKVNEKEKSDETNKVTIKKSTRKRKTSKDEKGSNTESDNEASTEPAGKRVRKQTQKSSVKLPPIVEDTIQNAEILTIPIEEGVEDIKEVETIENETIVSIELKKSVKTRKRNASKDQQEHTEEENAESTQTIKTSAANRKGKSDDKEENENIIATSSTPKTRTRTASAKDDGSAIKMTIAEENQTLGAKTLRRGGRKRAASKDETNTVLENKASNAIEHPIIETKEKSDVEEAQQEQSTVAIETKKTPIRRGRKRNASKDEANIHVENEINKSATTKLSNVEEEKPDVDVHVEPAISVVTAPTPVRRGRQRNATKDESNTEVEVKLPSKRQGRARKITNTTNNDAEIIDEQQSADITETKKEKTTVKRGRKRNTSKDEANIHIETKETATTELNNVQEEKSVVVVHDDEPTISVVAAKTTVKRGRKRNVSKDEAHIHVENNEINETATTELKNVQAENPVVDVHDDEPTISVVTAKTTVKRGRRKNTTKDESNIVVEAKSPPKRKGRARKPPNTTNNETETIDEQHSATELTKTKKETKTQRNQDENNEKSIEIHDEHEEAPSTSTKIGEKKQTRRKRNLSKSDEEVVEKKSKKLTKTEEIKEEQITGHTGRGGRVGRGKNAHKKEDAVDATAADEQVTETKRRRIDAIVEETDTSVKRGRRQLKQILEPTTSTPIIAGRKATKTATPVEKDEKPVRGARTRKVRFEDTEISAIEIDTHNETKTSPISAAPPPAKRATRVRRK